MGHQRFDIRHWKIDLDFARPGICDAWRARDICHWRLKCLLFIFIPVLLSSCAPTSVNLQPQINSLIVADKPQKALKVLESYPEGYGRNNELLYLFDKALVLHLAQKYEESISAFEQVKLKFDELYMRSLTKGAATWLINDYTDAYHGEDFEHVLVNIFQALNFAVLNNFSEALVEARDVDSKLNVINSQYASDQKNVYKEDAFARFLIGVLYEANRSAEDYNDAFISYRKAVEAYESDYATHYNLPVPPILKENLLSAARWMGEEEFSKYRSQYPAAPFRSLEEKRTKAQVYLIQYNGLSPLKIQSSLPIPLPDGFITKLAFPRYEERFSEIGSSQVVAYDAAGRSVQSESQLAQDIARIAMKNLENRRFRVMAKAAARPAGKYFLEKTTERTIRKKYGEDPALGFKIASGLFNLVSEQADLRSWQTLPSEIRVARLILEPGRYDLFLDNFDRDHVLMERLSLGKIEIKAGDTKFLIVRTVR